MAGRSSRTPKAAAGTTRANQPIIATPPGESPLPPFVAPSLRRFVAFTPTTQLEHARLGIVTPEMQRVAEREAHLTPEEVRDELAAGRLVIPANKTHLSHRLDPMAIGRATRTKINANMGASPVSSGTDEELEKLEWALKWGADTIMDLSTGGDLDACREAFCRNSTAPIGTVPIYSMIIGRKIEDLDEEIILDTLEPPGPQGRRLLHDPRGGAQGTPEVRQEPSHRHRLARRLAPRQVDDRPQPREHHV